MNPLDPESFLLTLQFDRSIFSPVIYLIQYMAHSRYLINVWSGPVVNDPPSNAGDEFDSWLGKIPHALGPQGYACWSPHMLKQEKPACHNQHPVQPKKDVL